MSMFKKKHQSIPAPRSPAMGAVAESDETRSSIDSSHAVSAFLSSAGGSASASSAASAPSPSALPAGRAVIPFAVSPVAPKSGVSASAGRISAVQQHGVPRPASDGKQPQGQPKSAGNSPRAEVDARLLERLSSHSAPAAGQGGGAPKPDVRVSLPNLVAPVAASQGSQDDFGLPAPRPIVNPYATMPTQPPKGYLRFEDVRGYVQESASQTQLSKRRTADDEQKQLATAGLNMSAAALKAHRLCTKFGTLSKRGGGKRSKAYRRRYFVLVGGNLFYFKGEKDKKPKGVISDLPSHVIGEGDAADEHSFSIVPSVKGPNPRAFVLCAKSAEEKSDWIRALPIASDAQVARIEKKLKGHFISADQIEWDEAGGAIGKGASGVVKKGVWLHTQAVAVKLLNNIPEFIDPDEFREFFQEIETLSQLRHPCIVSMFGYAKKDGYLALVTEYVAGGDLAAAIHAPAESSVPFCAHLKLSLLQNICKGMVYLHSRGVVHRDLKPGNILIENILQAKVKVCDFGLSIVPVDADSNISGDQDGKAAAHQQVFGSPAYAAPELPEPDHTELVDVFSFGIVTWELWLRTKPWLEYQHPAAISAAIQSGKRLDLELVVVSTLTAGQQDGASTEQLRSLISRCWHQTASSRPTFAGIFPVLEKLLEVVPDEQEQLLRAKNVSVRPGFDGSYHLSPGTEPQLSLSETLRRTLFRGEPVMPFAAWAEAALPVLLPDVQTPLAYLDPLRFLVADNHGTVQSDAVGKLFSWFQPFCADSDETSPNAWRASHALALLCQPAFVGFAAPADAKELLLRRPIGSFLFRFSSQVGMYVLSACWASGQVGHWRIATQVVAGIPIFSMNGVDYDSLGSIAAQHGPGATPIMAKDSAGRAVPLFLAYAVTKQEFLIDKESLYQANS